MENCLTSVVLKSSLNTASHCCWAFPKDNIMIRLILVSLFLHGSQANNCFERCEILSSTYGDYDGLVGEDVRHDYMGRVAITNYHCIMKCANRLSKATMDLALDNLHEDYNHQCTVVLEMMWTPQLFLQLFWGMF